MYFMVTLACVCMYVCECFVVYLVSWAVRHTKDMRAYMRIHAAHTTSSLTHTRRAVELSERRRASGH